MTRHPERFPDQMRRYDDAGWMRHGERFPDQMRRYDDAGKLGLVTGQDITEALVKLDAAASATDEAVDAMPALSPVARAQWKTWLAGYQKFSADVIKGLGFPWLGYPAIGDEIVAYEGELSTWQRDLRAAGAPIAGPDFISHTEASGPEVTTILEAATALVVAGGIVYALVKLLPGRRASR